MLVIMKYNLLKMYTQIGEKNLVFWRPSWIFSKDMCFFNGQLTIC